MEEVSCGSEHVQEDVAGVHVVWHLALNWELEDTLRWRGLARQRLEIASAECLPDCPGGAECVLRAPHIGVMAMPLGVGRCGVCVLGCP